MPGTRIRPVPPDKPGHDPGIDPLYLFACGLSWRKQGNAGAGWELVRGLKRSGQTARIAAALLAQAKDFELPADPSHSRAGPDPTNFPRRVNREHRMQLRRWQP